MRNSQQLTLDRTQGKVRDLNRTVFEELEFMRLANVWDICRRTTSLNGVGCGNRIFQRYHMVGEPSVALEFAYRGLALSERGAQLLRNLMSRLHVVSKIELSQVGELFATPVGKAGVSFVQAVEHAEVGAVNGRVVLAVYWCHRKSNRKVISVFIDANEDGKHVHEMHFSAPAHLYSSVEHIFNDTMRSSQWRLVAPPMVKIGA